MNETRSKTRMNKKMFVETGQHETRVAIMEDDELAELFIERHHQLSFVGNIYKGRVSRVLPGMQAAFVEIGLERDAFLYVGEVVGGPPIDASVVTDEDDENAEDEEEHGAERPPSPPSYPPIDELLRVGQELVVQVLKDPLPNKGARVSTQITLPGRYLVLLPQVAHLGVSRRIEDEEERNRLRSLLEELRPREDGLIVRTAGVGAGHDEFAQDLRFLQFVYQDQVLYIAQKQILRVKD